MTGHTWAAGLCLSCAAQQEAGFERSKILEGKKKVKRPTLLAWLFLCSEILGLEPTAPYVLGQCATLEQYPQPPDLCNGGKIPIFILISYNHRYKADIRGAKWGRKGQIERTT